MNADTLDGYRLARVAQMARFEAATGGVSDGSEHTPEFEEYFGLGDWAGGGEERLLTLGDWMRRNKVPEGDPPGPVEDDYANSDAPPQESRSGMPADLAFWLTGEELRGLAADGDAGAAVEIERRAVKRAAKRARKLAGVAA